MSLRFTTLLTALVAPLVALACSSSASPARQDGGRDASASDGSPWEVLDEGSDAVHRDDAPADATNEDTMADGGAASCANNKHPGDLCDVVAQNCPDPNTCDWDPQKGYNTCTPRPIGPSTKGEACDSKKPCDRGLFCFSNRCSPACCLGDNTVCGGDGACTLAITSTTPDGGTSDVVYHACSYNAACHAFQYDCPAGQFCLFNGPPAVFSCALPAVGKTLNIAPGAPCGFLNDCGESQLCTSITSSASDAGPSAPTCFLVCNLSGKPTPGDAAKLGGRFPADGTCTIGGKSYGRCTTITDGAGGDSIGGGLGLCVK
jgi:hypothetical protein